MSKTGLPRIDALFEGVPNILPIAPGDADKESVGAVQDLLRGHGQPGMPGPLAPDYGAFGNRTRAAVRGFRSANALPDSEKVDITMLQALVKVPAKNPIASRPYVTLSLDFAWNPMTKLLLLTSLPEGNGAFGAMNRNQDKAGLSIGIIQWAQKPKRLNEILQAFQASDSGGFTDIFGDGNVAVASGLVNHTAKANGGVDPSTGRTTDDQFDLINDTWIARFISASLSPVFQKTQVTTAQAAFTKALFILKGYAPELTTERAIAFMLDVANQFGDSGARSIYNATKQAGQPVADHLAAIATESVNRIQPQFRDDTRSRRDEFLNTTLLADA